MQKPPPPMFTRWESMKFGATPRMLRWVGSLLILFLAPMGAQRFIHPEPSKVGPMPLPVPVQAFTTEAREMVIPLMLHKLPEADPRQKNVVCERALGQVMLEGACWQLLPVEPPCPVDKGAFEHDKDHRCYVRVLRAERPKQSGEPNLVNIAGEE